MNIPDKKDMFHRGEKSKAAANAKSLALQRFTKEKKYGDIKKKYPIGSLKSGKESPMAKKAIKNEYGQLQRLSDGR